MRRETRVDRKTIAREERGRPQVLSVLSAYMDCAVIFEVLETWGAKVRWVSRMIPRRLSSSTQQKPVGGGEREGWGTHTALNYKKLRTFFVIQGLIIES